MEYFAGLDVSMEETHICVLDREGEAVYEAKVVSTPAAIADDLTKAPACRCVVFETGRMAPMLYHGLRELAVPVVCIVSRQAAQALKSLATHKTDRNNARGLAHLARTGFFKCVHVKSFSAHAVRSLIIARKKLVGQRVTLENQIRGLPSRDSNIEESALLAPNANRIVLPGFSVLESYAPDVPASNLTCSVSVVGSSPDPAIAPPPPSRNVTSVPASENSELNTSPQTVHLARQH